jgi:succinyl-CoA synthetase beta subunit
MNTHEYQAREVLAGYGVPFPPAKLAFTAAEVERVARDLGGAVVVKAQIHAGGRGKAGGVKRAASAEEARECALALLGKCIMGRPVRKVLVVQAVALAREIYLGAVIDRAAQTVTLMTSATGGVDIEEVARTTPGAIVKVAADPLLGLADYQARDLARAVGLAGEQVRVFQRVARGLYQAFIECDCSLLEVNPLGVTTGGEIIALDSKMVIDDNALFRRPALAALRDVDEEDPAEVEAQRVGVQYVKLGGQVGCMVNGAGLAMATMDAIKLFGGEPANFLDIGGGARPDQIDAALRIILLDPHVRAVLVNIFGGIIRCDVVAQAIAGHIAGGGVRVPVVARLVGTNAAEGREILSGTQVHLADTMVEAAEKAVVLAGIVLAPSRSEAAGGTEGP